MKTATIVRAEPHHAAAMAPRMRAADAQEVAAGGQTPLEALLEGLRTCESFAALVDGEVGAMFGFREVPMGTSALAGPMGLQLWFLTAEFFGAHPRPFIRAARLVLADLHARQQVLVSAIDARYRGALRLAVSLGFDLLPAVPFLGSGVPFHPVVMRSA